VTAASVQGNSSQYNSRSQFNGIPHYFVAPEDLMNINLRQYPTPSDPPPLDGHALASGAEEGAMKPPLAHDEVEDVEEEKARAEGGLCWALERREACRVSVLQVPFGTVLERFAVKDTDVNDKGRSCGLAW
jgi:hypothetical protein